MEHTISAAQFFAVQFLIRVTMTIALDPSAIAGENPLNTLLSYGLAMVLGAGLAVPVWLLHRQPGVAFGEQARQALGPLGRVVGLFYILYFVAANALSLGAFLELLEERLHPEFPLVLILAAVVAVAAYGAWRGLETIARTGACLCVLVLAGTALLFGTAAGRFQWENLQPLGDAPALRGAAVFLSRTSLFAEMAVLLPYVRGRRGLGFALWSLGTTVFVAALTLLLAGCLGPYAATQDFPVYTLASLSEVASLQRLEPVFAVLWMAGLLPQVAIGLYACRVCAASLGGKRPPWVIVPAALGMAALGLWVVSSKSVQSAFQDSDLWLTLTLLTGGGVPLVLWLLNKLRRKGARP